MTQAAGSLALPTATPTYRTSAVRWSQEAAGLQPGLANSAMRAAAAGGAPQAPAAPLAAEPPAPPPRRPGEPGQLVDIWA